MNFGHENSGESLNVWAKVQTWLREGPILLSRSVSVTQEQCFSLASLCQAGQLQGVSFPNIWKPQGPGREEKVVGAGVSFTQL